MGAYLSTPLTQKVSEDEENAKLAYGASAMQGWRVSQEDAHNAILAYDSSEANSYFAVYDGHGGHEVAQYTAQKLPDFIQRRMQADPDPAQLPEVLVAAFVEFDRTIIQRDVVAQLKILANDGQDPAADEEPEEDANEVNQLYEEATMPLAEVIHKYGSEEGGPLEPKRHPQVDLLAGEGSSAKPISPFLRAKRGGCTPPENSHIRFDDHGKPVQVKTDAQSAATLKAEPLETPPSPPHKGSDAQSVDSPTVKPPKPESPAVNGHGPAETATSAHEASLNGTHPADDYRKKGKGKGQGKGRSNLVKSSQSVSEPEPPASPPAASQSPRLPRKTAAQLYQSIIEDAPADDDDSEDESDDDVKFNEVSSDDDDDDEDADVPAAENGAESEDDEEDSDEDTAEEGEEFIGGEFNDEPGNDSGCTAVVALLKGQTLYVANAGDSRCVVCRNGEAVEMSFDHKPEDKLEQDRIVKAGGKVTPDGRVNGGLNLSRAIGDHAYKTNKSLPLEEQMISPVPDIKTLEIDYQTDSFMILACDGIWNSMSSQEVVDYVHPRLKALKPDQKLSSICQELFDTCLAPDTMGDGTGCDNMTALIVKFKAHQFPTNDSESSPSATANSKSEPISKLEPTSQKRVSSTNSNDESDKLVHEPAAKRVKRDDSLNSDDTL